MRTMEFHENPISGGRSKIRYDIKVTKFTGILISMLSCLVQNICQYHIWFWNYNKFRMQEFNPGFKNWRELPLNHPPGAQMSPKRGKSMPNNFSKNFLNFYLV